MGIGDATKFCFLWCKCWTPDLQNSGAWSSECALATHLLCGTSFPSSFSFWKNSHISFFYVFWVKLIKFWTLKTKTNRQTQNGCTDVTLYWQPIANKNTHKPPATISSIPNDPLYTDRLYATVTFLQLTDKNFHLWDLQQNFLELKDPHLMKGRNRLTKPNDTQRKCFVAGPENITAEHH